MSRKVDLDFGSRSAAVKSLGRTYKGPADAAKEPICNALDEHIKPENSERAKELGICKVIYTVKKNQIVIEMPYGMSEARFEEVVQNIAKSIKVDAKYNPIGHQAIGLFSWFQFAGKCVYYSKSEDRGPTIKVTIKEGMEEADFEIARSRESLKNPGMKLVISDLHSDPTKGKNPLSAIRFQKYLGNKFRHYLREKLLAVEIHSKSNVSIVEPVEINLPRIAEDYPLISIRGDQSKKIGMELYFDASGKGVVSIRHQKVPNVEDIRTLDALGFESSIFGSGFLTGFLDPTFLTPDTGKTSFTENEAWFEFIAKMNEISPSIEAEIEHLKKIESAKRLAKVQQEAIQLANEILNDDYFLDLALLEGLQHVDPPEDTSSIIFDFVPSTLRIDPGTTKQIMFNACVPEIVPDGGVITFKIDNPFIKISPKRVTVKASDADFEGMVSFKITLSCDEEIDLPAILKAKHKEYEAEARIRFTQQEVYRGSRKDKETLSFNYVEVAFEEDPLKHSRLIANIIQINTLNPDYLKAIRKSERDMIEYAGMMIAKETIVHGDKSGVADDAVEKLLTFYFRLKSKIGKMPVGKIVC